MKTANETRTELKPGMKFTFVPTGKVFEIKTVTENKVAWWLGFSVKSGWGKNTMKCATTSRNIFEKAITDGHYKFN